MPKTKHHMSVNIQGLLDNYKGRVIDIITDDDGKQLTDQQARIHLHNLQIEGDKYMCCSSECEGFDPLKGCPSHEIKVCDLCGNEFTGKSHEVLDENFNIQKGLISCGCNLNTDDNS
jgi:hypothetical protein